MRSQRLFCLVVILALAGCQSLRPTPLVGVGSPGQPTTVQSLSDASVQGRVDFGSRTTQATPADVVNAATVSFIDTGTNQTVATGKTDAAGSFTLTLGTYTPVNGGTYLLEAVKGLNAQAPGSDAARFRTVLRWNGTGWQSCTNSTVPGSIVINSLTTALAIETALDPANVPASNTIGKVNVGTNPATLNPTPGPYVNHPDSEIAQLASDLLSYLGADTDPLASVPSIAPSLSSFQPTSAGANSLVRIVGSGFSPVPSGNTVTFNGIGAQVLVATPTTLVVVVPAGATTGTLRVVTGRGSVDSGTPFSVSTSGATGGLAITGFSPAFGRADTDVTLSGSFGTGTATPTVTFTGPAGVPVAAQVSAWTPTSLSVTVPIGAQPGGISVQSGASTVTSLGTFDVWQGDVTLMNNITPASASLPLPGSGYALPYTLYDPACVRWGNYAYIIGGYRGAHAADVLMFPLNADGSLGAMRKAGTLLTGRSEHSAVVAGNYLYVFGGNGGNVSIERAPLNADGTLGSFQAIGNLQRQRAGSRAVVHNNSVYVFGGYDTGGIDASTAERYAIDAGTGNLTFVATYNLTVGSVAFPIRKCGVAMLGSKILIVGGGMNTPDNSKSLTIPINADGTLGDGTYGPDLGYKLRATTCAIVNNELYVMSGYDGATDGYYSVVLRAPVDPVAGTVSGPFVAAASQVQCSAWGVSIANGNHLYSFGGLTKAGALALIQVAEVQPDKSLAAWASLGATRESYYGHVAFVSGNRAWRIGGYSTTTGQYLRSTDYHAISEDGTWGPSRSGPNLTVNRYSSVYFIRGAYLYVIGGHDGSIPIDTVERASLNPATGEIGPFVRLSSTLARATRWAALAVVGDYVYVLGGTSEIFGGNLDAIQRARVLPDGSLTAFELLPTRLPEPLHAIQAEVVGNYVYVLGGATPTGITNHAFRAKINPANGSMDAFTRLSDLPISVYTGVVKRIGNYLYYFGGWLVSSANNQAVIRAPIRPDGGIGAWENPTPGGRQIMPVGTSHIGGGGALIYRDWIFLASGYQNGTNVLQGSVR